LECFAGHSHDDNDGDSDGHGHGHSHNNGIDNVMKVKVVDSKVVGSNDAKIVQKTANIKKKQYTGLMRHFRGKETYGWMAFTGDLIHKLADGFAVGAGMYHNNQLKVIEFVNQN
jgi:zinc transporter ZupT